MAALNSRPQSTAAEKKIPMQFYTKIGKKFVTYSPGVDPSQINKKDYQEAKFHFRCVHVGCKSVLSRQCWRPHIEMDHIDGKKTFKKKHVGETFPCTDCDAKLPTRRARELHRRKVHSISKQIQKERL